MAEAAPEMKKLNSYPGTVSEDRGIGVVTRAATFPRFESMSEAGKWFWGGGAVYQGSSSVSTKEL